MHRYEEILRELNEKIWDYSELKFEEYKSSAQMQELLKAEGFETKSNLGGMETAFMASFGQGAPVIGLLAEFDALSGMSQQADVMEPMPREGAECGHGCGHCLLGTAVVGAALAVRDYLLESKKAGTVVLVGCPAEEGGSGKAYLARDGVFDGLDVALTWHPGGGNAVGTGSMQANCQAYFKFKGVTSHAAASPHLGRSALDAVELMNVGVNYMREHMEPTDRIHYAVLDTGGTSPNVVQGHAEVIYLIRSTETEKVNRLYERVKKVAQGAALMTETEVTVVFDKACSNILSNSVLEQVLYDSMKKAKLPEYTKEEQSYAEEFKRTITMQDLGGELSIQFLENRKKKELMSLYAQKNMADFVQEYRHLDIQIAGSSDVGDVSHVVPTAQFIGACFVPGTPAHSWQMVAQGKSATAVKGMLYAADVLKTAAIAIIEDPSVAKRAREEFVLDTEGKPYECPIPAEIKPNMNAKNKQ